MKPDDDGGGDHAALDAEVESLRQQVADLDKQLRAQREAFDRRGRALIALQNDNYRLRSAPLERFWAADAPDQAAAAPGSESSQEREARFRETEALTRRLMEAEDQLADARRRRIGRLLRGLMGKARTLARKLRRR